MKLLNIDANPKTVKGQAQGYMTAVLYLAPGNLSGWEVCANRTDGCFDGCIFSTGHAAIAAGNATFVAPNGDEVADNHIVRARIARTRMYFLDRPAFLDQLQCELAKFVNRAARRDLIPCVRLNGTSDIPWERVRVGASAHMMAAFPQVQFYDYTKRANRRALPSNYHLTFSLAENNDAQAAQALRNGMNVAAVFRKTNPASHYTIAGVTRPLVNGDESDLRFLDPKGCIVGLYAKGRKAKADTTGFVRDFAPADFALAA